MAYKAIWRTKQYSIQNNMTYKATWNTKQIIFKSGWSVRMIAALIFKTMFCLFWVQILHLLMNEDISVVIKYTLYIAHSPFECPYCEISFLLKLAKCHALFLSFLLSSFFLSLRKTEMSNCFKLNLSVVVHKLKGRTRNCFCNMHIACIDWN